MDEEANRRLTTDQIEHIFTLFDRDNDGIISQDDLVSLFAYLGQQVTKMEIVDLVAEVDTNHSGQISFKDFHSMLSKKIRDIDDIRENIIHVIGAFDLDGRGYVSENNIRTIFTYHFEDVTERELENLIQNSKKNAEGEIRYDDLVTKFLYPI